MADLLQFPAKPLLVREPGPFWDHDRLACRLIAEIMQAFPNLPRRVSGAIEDYYDHRRVMMHVIPPSPPEAA